MTALAEFLLANALAASLLAVAVGLLGLWIRQPEVRRAMWLIVFLRLFLPPIWTVPIGGVSARIPAVETVLQPCESPAAGANSIAHNESSLETDAPFDIQISGEFSVAKEPESQLSRMNDASGGAFDFKPFLGIFGYTILVTGAILIGFAAWRIFRFQKFLSQTVTADPLICQRADQLAQKMGLIAAPAIRLTPCRTAPLLWSPGLFRKRAVIVLPVKMAMDFDGEKLDAIVAHELAHLRRRDDLLRWLELASVCFYWWLPCLYLMRRGLRQAEEECCDRIAVACTENSRGYAAALVDTLVFLGGSKTRKPLLASSVSPIRNLRGRIEMIMIGNRVGRWTRLGMMATFGVAAIALAVGPALSRTEAQAPPEPPKGERKDQPPARGEGRDQPPARGEAKDPPPPPRGEGREPPARGEGKGLPPLPPRGEGRDPQPKEGNKEEIEKARKEADEARAKAEKAMQAFIEAQGKLDRLEGRRPLGGLGGIGGGGFPPPTGGGGGVRGPMGGGPPMPPEGGRPAEPRKIDGQGDRLADLERQLKRLSDELEAMRHDSRKFDGEPKKRDDRPDSPPAKRPIDPGR